MTRSCRRVVAVSGHPQRAELLDALLIDANEYDVVFVESIVHGYSRIKQEMPDLIIVYCAIDDVDACRLLSMLQIDGDVSGTPVVTCAGRREEPEFDEIIAELDRNSSRQRLVLQMH
jgi:DNA-binding response OmpR family regulator